MLVFATRQYGANKMPIKKGDKVKVEYKGTLEDGTLFESSEMRGGPLEFIVGAGQVIKGFENAVIGMEKGEEKEIKLQPSEAYGVRNPQLIKKISRSQLPKEPEPKPGLEITMGQPNGTKAAGRVVEVTDEAVTVDLNHPMAGKVLNYKVKAVDILS